MNQLLACLLIAGGSAAGGVSRYLIALAVQERMTPGDPAAAAFPWGTLTVNLLGCLIIGVAAALLAGSERKWIEQLAIVGFLGGFTTFSAFSWQTLDLAANRGRWDLAAAYIGASVIGCLLVTALGWWLVRLAR